MGDHSEVHGDAIALVVGSGTLHADEIVAFKATIDGSAALEEDIKEKLKEARAAIEQLEVSDAHKHKILEDLLSLTSGLQKSERNNEQLQSYWKRIRDNAPTAASILSSASTLAKLIGLG